MCSLFGEPWDSAGEFGPRFGASGALNVPDQRSSVDADSTPCGGNRFVGGFGVETESIPRCSEIYFATRGLLTKRSTG